MVDFIRMGENIREFLDRIQTTRIYSGNKFFEWKGVVVGEYGEFCVFEGILKLIFYRPIIENCMLSQPYREIVLVIMKMVG